MSKPVEADFGHNLLKVIDLLLEGKGNILELGSGNSSYILSQKGYKVTAVEHNLEWLNKFPSVEYIYAPITELPPSRSFEKRYPGHKIWYDGNAIKKGIEGKKFDLMIVDGPPKYIGRSGIYVYRDIFDWTIPVLWDNTDRQVEIITANFLSFGKGHRTFLTFHNEMGWSFSITSPDPKVFIKVLEHDLCKR